MSKIFLSYRRSDSAGWAGRIADRLSSQFGPQAVFMDVQDITPGLDWTSLRRKELEGTDVVVALIGPDWLDSGLSDVEDYVRQELSAALTMDVPIVPVLIDGASMPASTDLPHDLSVLTDLQAMTIRSSTFGADMERLIQELEHFVHVPWWRRILNYFNRPLPQTTADSDRSQYYTERTFEDLEAAERLREEWLEKAFTQNVREPLIVEQLELRGIDFFSECNWRIQPGFNVILGRNGYGKSLMLRTLAALLKRDAERSGSLIEPGRDFALELTVRRQSDTKVIRRLSDRFAESVGEVPILALPDSRFTDRSSTSVGNPGPQDLLRDGAWHFLNQVPFQSVIESFLWGVCLDYQQGGMNQPVFGFIESVVGGLTQDRFTFDSIERNPRDEFLIKVRTESYDKPLPLQYASQGTLSVVAMFGLIRTFLQQSTAEADESLSEDQMLARPGIVLIDEFDAHLHPTWQRRLRGLLTSTFPNVQFIVSAHSPLVVAGASPRQVTILRMGTDGLVLEQMERDFIGASAAELYEVFDVTEPDEVFVRYAAGAAEASIDPKRLQQLEDMEESGQISPREEIELRGIREKRRLTRRVQSERRKQKSKDELIRELEAQLAAQNPKSRG